MGDTKDAKDKAVQPVREGSSAESCKHKREISKDTKRLGVVMRSMPHDKRRADDRSYSSEQESLVVCADCSSNMVLKKDQNGRKYYLCSRVPACLGNHSAHPDGSPVGIPGDKETRLLRRQCHEKLDSLWKGGECTRVEAYVVLQKILNLTEEEAHIGKLNKQQCLTFLKQFDMLGSAVTILIPQRD